MNSSRRQGLDVIGSDSAQELGCVLPPQQDHPATVQADHAQGRVQGFQFAREIPVIEGWSELLRPGKSGLMGRVEGRHGFRGLAHDRVPPLAGWAERPGRRKVGLDAMVIIPAGYHAR